MIPTKFQKLDQKLARYSVNSIMMIHYNDVISNVFIEQIDVGVDKRDDRNKKRSKKKML
jgi:hypothetical protein